MSEPIPESIPTSSDPRSRRPLKRRALTPKDAQATSVDALFAKPDLNIPLPSDSTVSKKSAVPAPPEIVANVQGSSAGAGSGEFHVYKASRRREYERVKAMDEEVERERKDEEFERVKEEKKRKDEEKTEKNRRRREKKKNKGKGAEPAKVNGEVDKNKSGLRKGPAKPNGLDQRGQSEDEGQNEPENVVEELGVVIHDDD
ncbi:MAG: hypothetical protein HETSPECPRED_004942 [Heterodermia speciosa]|uniref:DUF1168-domain-containing protein n=1 Tax=Heterodermia speciosa TaxID=116794 RepID=A0A8H3EGP2_9LECA|nr:MAG: hypothetical protein HETSPECPRED_004942 [Heterodermia speciosa]